MFLLFPSSLVILIVYVFIVPFSFLTFIWNELNPSLSDTVLGAYPLTNVDFLSSIVALIIALVMSFLVSILYVVVFLLKFIVPTDTDRLDRLLFDDLVSFLVIFIVYVLVVPFSLFTISLNVFCPYDRFTVLGPYPLVKVALSLFVCADICTFDILDSTVVLKIVPLGIKFILALLTVRDDSFVSSDLVSFLVIFIVVIFNCLFLSIQSIKDHNAIFNIYSF